MNHRIPSRRMRLASRARRFATRFAPVAAVLATLALVSAIAYGSRAPLAPKAERAFGASSHSAQAVASTPGVTTGGVPASSLLEESGRGRRAPALYPDAGEIQLGNGFRFDPIRDGEPVVPAELQAGEAAAGTRGGYLVQLKGPVEANQREQIEAAGAIVVSYLPNYTFLVRVSPSVRARVQALPFVRWVGAWQPAYKLSAEPEMSLGGGSATMVVLLYPDADLAAERAALEAMGGTVVEATDSGRNKIVRVTIDGAQAQTMASRNDVAWVEPWHQPMVQNSSAQWVVQTNVTNNRRVWDMGIHGEGQVVHTSDSGIRTSHNQFRDDAWPITTFGDYPNHRKIIAYKAALPSIIFGDASGASYHGTHTAGSICGDDSPFAADLRDGEAKGAKIFFTDAGNLVNTISTPGDLNLLFGPAYVGNAGGAARISSNSWGANSNNYDVQAMSVDQFMWDHKDFLIFFSNGNMFAAAQVGTPAVSKNSVGVGATQNGAASGVKASFSSEGPTEDGRHKPTVCAPGDGVTPLSGLASANGANDTGYANLSGTSMASPTAAGATALVRQYLTDGWYPTGAPVPAHGFNPSAALLKAMGINSTDNDMPGHPIPDFAVGWGRILLDNVLYFPGDAARSALIDENAGLLTGDFAEYKVVVDNSTVPLKITLCWTDKEGNPASLLQLVNDLDLTVMDPNGAPYLGNVMSGGQSAPGGAADILNVEEGVRLNAPLTGTWTIRVDATNVAYGPQPFAIAVTGGITSTSALLALDRHVYGQADVIQVRVQDGNAAGTVTVAVASTTESTPETLTLSGSGGIFTGTIATTTALVAGGDGMLSVANGDAITVDYVDASPAVTTSANALADFDGPLLTDVVATERGETQLVTWASDVPASSRVYYGTTTALGQASELDPDLVSAHRTVLGGLQYHTEYFYDVESEDQGGNTVRDDNGGRHYRFVSGNKGDVLVVVGDASFPAVDFYVDALFESGWNPALLVGGVIDEPPVGNLISGLRSYTAVWWQPGLEQYPAIPDAARDSLDALIDGGARLAVNGHDIAWSFTDPASGVGTPARMAWLNNRLHARFIEDPATWAANQGVLGDPISDSYVAGVAYSPHRQGGAGDEIAIVPGPGTASYVWKDTDATQDNIAIRWESAGPNGSPANAVWGGTPSRLLYNAFEWGQIVMASDRTGILDKSLLWLIGKDHPDAAVTAPNGAEVVTGTTTAVSWTETPHDGASIATRAVYYSTDGGASWNLVTANAGTSPYTWDVSGLENGGSYRVRVEVTDDGDPALRGRDASDADFAIDRPNNDSRGPVVVAGSIRTDPNPIDNREVATLYARVSDAADGGSGVTAAEWSHGASPAPAGHGIPMNGPYIPTSNEIEVTTGFRIGLLAQGDRRIWVRGRDAAGNWGPATSRVFAVNGDATVGVEEQAPLRFALMQNAPNPVLGAGTMIHYALPRAGRVRLEVYGVQGQRVRTLVSEFQPAGRQSIAWNRRDDAGHRVPSGVYFYRLEMGVNKATRKMVVLE